jgi:bla regulator protein BlaR1
MQPQYIGQAAVHAICWTLMHSLWQGILAAMLAGLVIICTRKLPALIRYRLLAMDLLLFVLAVGITFWYQVKQVHGGSALAGSQILVPALDQTTGTGSSNLVRSHADYQPLLNYRPVVNYLNRHAFIIVDVWLLCLFVQLSRLMAGLYGIRRLRRSAAIPAGKWSDTMLLLAGQLGLKRKVSLLESASIKIPAAIGFFKPVILVPLGLLSNLPADQVETILLHELAHIKRGDYLTNLLLHITEALFFFNPGLRWLNALIRREREACCDDMVLSVTVDRTVYLDALVSFREYITGKRTSSYAVALGRGRRPLFWRVRRMLTQENKTLDIMEKTILSFGLAALIAVGLISMNPVQAQTPPAPPIPAPLPPAKTVPVPIIIRDTLPGQAQRDTLQLTRDREKLAKDRERTALGLARIVKDTPQLTRDREKLAMDSEQRIYRIIGDLKENHLIPDENLFSFSLDSDRLLVNDKPAPDPVFQKLKGKYVHSPSEHFSYLHNGRSTQTDISVDND